MAKPTAPPAAESTDLAVSEPVSALATVQDVLANILQADTDPTERMTNFILTQPASEWESLWAGLPSARDFVGRPIIVHDLRARESDFEGPLGVYLILDATDLETGAHELISCSSQMSIVQLVTLRRRGQLPAKVVFVAKDKPTKAGFRPIHLRYIGGADAPLGDPGAVISEQ